MHFISAANTEPSPDMTVNKRRSSYGLKVFKGESQPLAEEGSDKASKTMDV